MLIVRNNKYDLMGIFEMKLNSWNWYSSVYLFVSSIKRTRTYLKNYLLQVTARQQGKHIRILWSYFTFCLRTRVKLDV